MTTQLIRARKKPRYGLPWLSMVLGIGTLVFGCVGFTAVTAQPSEPVEVTVEGDHPWNISQATVDATLSEPLHAWKPLRIKVTNRQLTSDEATGRQDPGADLVLSTAIFEEAHSYAPGPRLGKVVIYPVGSDGIRHYANSFAVERAYVQNVGLGHGPAAVAASAKRAAELLDDGPTRSPIFWVSGTALGLLLTVLSLAISLPRRMRREFLFRRLTTAQHQLARVVLELEALEVTYLAAGPDRRPPGFTAAWTQIRDTSLDLARTEDPVVEAVYSVRRSLAPPTARLVATFEEAARNLAIQADALMGAGSVLGRLAGSESTLDRLAAPLNLAARELLARLHTAPSGSVPRKQIRALSAAAASLLTAGARKSNSVQAVAAWENAERTLERSAAAVDRSLRRTRLGRVRAPAYAREELPELRAGLGMSADGSRRALAALDAANAAARSLFGPLSQTAGLREPSGVRHRPRMPFVGSPGLWVTGFVLIVLVSVLAGGVVSDRVTTRPSWMLTGTQKAHSLAIDGQVPGLSEASIRNALDDKFTERVDITLAVRDAGDYLRVNAAEVPKQTLAVDKIDPLVLLDALWRIKSELPHLVDPATGELLPHQAIVPVWTFPGGVVHFPVHITGTVSVGGNSTLNDGSWVYGNYFWAEPQDHQVATTIHALSRGLQGNGYTHHEINKTLLHWLLTLAFALALTTLVQVLIYGGAISMRLGRFGRNAATLRTIRRELEALALGLDDSRLNTVAVLGAGSAGTSAEADQRIFERAVAVAWRMADDLAARPLAQRLGADYLAQIDRLGDLVARLGIRDAETARRTRELLDAAFTRPTGSTSSRA